jgi:serine phosphatase RsbU (regulator of sigma subunit)
MKINKLIIISISLLIISCSNSDEKNILPIVKDGVADLSGWNFSSNGNIELNGEWEFYYGQLLEPDDFTSGLTGNRSYISVPNAWDSFLYNDKKIGSWAHATYRLNIITRDNNPVYIKIMPPNSACKVWANGNYYGEIGRVAKNFKDEIPKYKSVVYDFEPVNNKIELIIQVSNYSIYLGGMILPVTAGHRENLYGQKNKRIAFDIFMFASLLVISVYYSGLYLMRKSDKSNLFFSVFTLLLSARALVTNEMYLYELLPDANWQIMYKIDFITTTLCVPVFIHFIYLIYPGIIKKPVRIIFTSIAVIYSLLILFSSTRIYSFYLPAYNIVTLIACLFVLYVLIRAMIDKQEGANLALSGFMILFFTVINDILSVNNIIHTMQLSSFGVFAFILMQSLISSMKFASAFNRIEDLSLNLEIKVNTRTLELEREKELLRSRNETIENELIIAKKIQKQIIPRHSPVDNIYAFYKPMDKVGGDFYDFIKYRDSEKIGIFLSDVSGHGVPAAFITSMVKTSILQAGACKEDPADLLASLNDTLVNQTGGNFVTAFYGIYTPSTKDFIYSNSGHNPPFILSSGIVANIQGTRSIPLAIFDNKSLSTGNKIRSNNSIRFESGDKILFYTDGLTEAVSRYNHNRYFEDDLVNTLIRKYSNNPPKEFIRNIYDELVQFHGSDLFDDDICMICMDIE